MSKNSSKVSNENKQGMVFRSKFAQKWILELDFEKFYSRFGISSFKISCVPIFIGPNLAKNEFWGQNFRYLSPDSESAPPRYHVFQFSDKTDSFDFFGPNLPEN